MEPLLGGITLHPDAQRVFDDPQAALKEVVELLQAMIRNGCVNYGNGNCDERPNIKVLSDYLDSKGVSYEIHHKPGLPHRPNLISKYGTGKPRVMLGPGHVDVVPVKGQSEGEGKVHPGWEMPPFSGAIKDGKVYGRGACDMLSTVAAQVVTYANFVAKGLPVEGTLLFCAVSDEEDGGAEGVGFLLNDPVLKEVFAADYTVTEIGGATMLNRRLTPTKHYMEANSEKGAVVLEIECKGKSGHGSVPFNGDNALVRAAQVVDKISKYWAPTVITDEWRSFVSALDVPSVAKWALTQRWLLGGLLRLLLGVNNPLGPLGHASTRMTMSPNHLTGTQKVNTVPGAVTVEVDARVLPGQDQDYVMDQVRRALGGTIFDDKEHYAVKIRKFYPATTSSVDTPFWRAMERAGKEVVPGSSFHQMPLPGATDNRYYRRCLGAHSYGFNVFDPSTHMGLLLECFHGENERIGVKDLWTSLQFFTLSTVYMMRKVDG